MSAIYVLEHYNILDTDRARMFTNVDYALDFLQVLLKNDPFIQNYDLIRYVLDEEAKQYTMDKLYDLKELISDSDVSVIDSDEDNHSVS